MAGKIWKITAILGVTAGILAILYGSAELAEKIRMNNRVERSNVDLIGQMPVLSKTIIIEPRSNGQQRVNVSLKIFKNGDIIIESGAARKVLSLALDYQGASADWIAAPSLGQETTRRMLDGTRYKVKTVKFIEMTAMLDANTILEKKTYEDGTIEIKKIDARSNTVRERQSTIINLTDQQKTAIRRSPYDKEGFQEVPQAP